MHTPDHDRLDLPADLRGAQIEAVAIELYQEALDPHYWEELERQLEAVALGFEQAARREGRRPDWQVENRAACAAIARRQFGALFDGLGMRPAPDQASALRFDWAGHPWELAIGPYSHWRLTRLDPCGPDKCPSARVECWEPVRRLWVALYQLQYLPLRCAGG